MYKYQIIIEYDGTNYVGWQKQKNGKSIQETIEKVLKKLLKYKIILYGSGRTDAGVHAIGQSAHFATEYKITNKNIFLNSLNFFLNNLHISILDIRKKNKNFHARYDAKERIYKYIILNRNFSSPFDLKKAWHIKNKLNIKLMKKASKLLIGKKDFSTFRASSCNANSPIKTLKKIEIKKKKNKIILLFKSKSFLQNQVRSMVGCLKVVGENKWALSDFKSALDSKNRKMCAKPAPAYGLYLLKVLY
jgi:tRNA pseudouridine38-40 synthase